MAGAAETDSRCDLTDRQFGFIEQKALRFSDTPSEYIFMRRQANSLAERPLEVPHADTCQGGKLPQSDPLRKVPLDVVQDLLQTERWQPSGAPWRRRRQRRIRVDDMMCQELASALGIELARRRAYACLSHETSHHAFDYVVAHSGVARDLKMAGVGSPMLGDHARQEGVKYEQRRSTKRCARISRYAVVASR